MMTDAVLEEAGTLFAGVVVHARICASAWALLDWAAIASPATAQAPAPYTPVEAWARLPQVRTWGAVTAARTAR